MTVGEKIRAYRKKQGLSQNELAKVSGISAVAIKKYELGTRNPKSEQLRKIANALKLSECIFYEFDVTTAGDVLSLLFILDNAIELEFDGEKIDGEYDKDSVCLKFKNSYLKKLIAEWANIKYKADEIKKEANDVTNEESKVALIECADEIYNEYKMRAVNSHCIVKK